MIGRTPATAQQSKSEPPCHLQKNTEANDNSYNLNQKTIQALDVLAKEYVDFEVTMANATHEQEAGDVLHVATLEVAEELNEP